MIDAMVRKVLLDTPAVTDLVSTRIYVDEIPDPAVLPAITVYPISDPPDRFVSKKGEARIQCSCWAETGEPKNPAILESVAAAVKAVMHNPRFNNQVERWTIGSVSLDITGRVVTGGVRLIDPVTGWYHKPVDVLISYNEV